MKQKIITLLLLAFITVLAAAGCSGSVTEKATTLSDAEIDALFAQRITPPELVGNEKPNEPISTRYADRGLLRISYVAETDAKLKLQVMKGDDWVAYNLKADGSNEDFSLQYGSGEYTVRIMQNVQGDEYMVLESKTFTANIADETQVFLNSIQNVNWNYDMLPIEDVRKIIAAALQYADDDTLDDDAADDLYRFVCSHLTYDHDKIFDLEYKYLPDIEQIYEDGKGICYDYASLLAAMLRSIGIPTKLVKGYASYSPTVYHAWNEVFLNGQWYVIDSTYDSTTGVYTPIFKNAEDYAKTYEY